MTNHDNITEPLRLGPGFNLHITDDARPIYEMYTADLDSALRAAVHANGVGLGWVLAGYLTADGAESVEDAIEQRVEYHLTAWRELTSETLPLSTEHITTKVHHGESDEETHDDQL